MGLKKYKSPLLELHIIQKKRTSHPHEKSMGIVTRLFYNT